jgi:hypothetical protein
MATYALHEFSTGRVRITSHNTSPRKERPNAIVCGNKRIILKYLKSGNNFTSNFSEIKPNSIVVLVVCRIKNMKN